MEVFVNQVDAVFSIINGYAWGWPMLIIIFGTGILLTIRLRGLQFRRLGFALKIAFSKKDKNDDSAGDISHFQALMTALAATIGTGNIIGVAGAMFIGGPGALFWMWLTALLGMATKYAEGLLAVKYRITQENGEVAGGPMYYIEKGLNMKWLAICFALFGAIAAFGIGNMVQANAIAENMLGSFAVPKFGTGILLSALTAAVVLGGVKRIGQVTGLVVPFMAVIYVLACLIIILMNITAVPAAFGVIISHAFTGTAAVGGFAGSVMIIAMRYGVARGIFSNEAGLGSAPIAAAAAKTKYPAEQALVSMTGTFIDTIVVCTFTGLVIVLTGVWHQDGISSGIMTQTAFDLALPGIGKYIITIGIIFFAYSTILGWAYYGEKCFSYIAGEKSIIFYRLIWVVFVFIGAAVKIGVVWNISDTLNALMAVPNLIALVLLSKVVVDETNKYLSDK